MTVDEINKAISAQKESLTLLIAGNRAEIVKLQAKNKEHAAALASLPRPPIKRVRKAGKVKP